MKASNMIFFRWHDMLRSLNHLINEQKLFLSNTKKENRFKTHRTSVSIGENMAQIHSCMYKFFYVITLPKAMWLSGIPGLLYGENQNSNLSFATCPKHKKIKKRKEITFFIMVSFFHVSTPLRNAFVDVPTSHQNQSRVLFIGGKCLARGTTIFLTITYKENNKQNRDHPISKYNVESHSYANTQHKHWLDEQCQIIVNDGHIKCRMP